MKAQTIKADILLNFLRDKEGYTQCFQKLVDSDRQSAKYHSMLGEAYLKILNPEMAVASFEASYRLDPTNSKLRARIGKALIATHEYHRAIDFYESALKDAVQKHRSNNSNDSSFNSLSHDLARLYMKLSRSDSAINTLEKALSYNQPSPSSSSSSLSSSNQISSQSQRDLHDMRMDVQSLLLLVEIQSTSVSQSPVTSSIINYLKRARDLQKSIVSETRMLVNSTEAVEAEKLILSVLNEQVYTSTDFFLFFPFSFLFFSFPFLSLFYHTHTH